MKQLKKLILHNLKKFGNCYHCTYFICFSPPPLLTLNNFWLSLKIMEVGPSCHMRARWLSPLR